MSVTRRAKIHGTEVEVIFPPALAEVAGPVMSMKAFTEWCAGVDRKFIVKNIEIQSVDMFGPRAGFIKFKANVSDKDKTTIPSIVFMRGAAVAVLFILRCDVTGEQFTILTVQARFPTGKYRFADIPAGMVDDKGDFTGVCAKEIQEETGLIVNVGDLIDLTRLAIDKDNTVKSRGMPGIYPSCGGCDEYLKFYACRKTMKKADIDALVDKCTGVEAENEKIFLKIVSIHDLWHSSDAKALVALSLYTNLVATRRLQDWTKTQGETRAERERNRVRGRLGKMSAESGSVMGLKPGSVPVGGSEDGILDAPWGVAVSMGGNVFVTDTNNNRVQVFSTRNEIVLVGPKNQFVRPRGVAVKDHQYFAVADSGNNEIKLVKLDNGTLLRSIGRGELNNPHAVAYDGVDNGVHMLVADTGNHRIVVFDREDKVVRTIGSHGSGPGQFNSPMGIALDMHGRYVVADTGNHRVQVLTPDGTHVMTIYGDKGPGSGLDQFDCPTSVVVDSKSRIHVADMNNGRILTFAPDGRLLDGRRGPRAGVMRYSAKKALNGRQTEETKVINLRRWKPLYSGIAIDYDDRLVIADHAGHYAMTI